MRVSSAHVGLMDGDAGGRQLIHPHEHMSGQKRAGRIRSAPSVARSIHFTSVFLKGLGQHIDIIRAPV